MVKDKIYSQNENFVCREIDDELIIIPISRTNTEINEMHALNPTATYIWNCFDGKRSLEKIRKKVLDNCFGAPEDEITGQFNEIVKDLISIKALREKKTRKAKPELSCCIGVY